MTGSSSARGRAAAALAAGAALYAGLLLFRYRTVPGGITNDAAEEALRGLILVEERRLEAITFVLGQSLETLWLYVMGLTAKLVGPGVVAIVLPSVAAATATAVLVTLLVRRLAPGTPALVPFLLTAGSPWLFHYGRTGFRAIAAPLFLALSALLLARADDGTARPARFAAAGAAVGLSVYAYTACRLLPVALGLAFLAKVAFDRPNRRAWARAAGAALLGFSVVSIPNAVFFVRRPVEFLVRGAYVVMGTPAQRLGNLVATVLLPFHYPYRYRFLWGDAHVFDAVSAEFGGTGMDPVPLAAGILCAAGLVLRLRRTRDLTTLTLALTLAAAILVLGPFGPSLTRLLVVLPVYTVFASFAAGSLGRTPTARRAVGAGLALLAAVSLSTYFARLTDPSYRPGPDMAPAQTALGERAQVAAEGRVVCVVTRNQNVVRYLAHRRDGAVFEFRSRPFDVREVLPALPTRTLLLERDPLFAPWHPPGYVESGPQDRYFRVLEPAEIAIPPTGP